MTDTRDAVLHSAPGALVLEHVTRRYPGNPDPSVDDLSLTIAPGELLALVGASGSGKTTTLRIAAGYETPDAGRVLLGDGRGAPADMRGDYPLTDAADERAQTVMSSRCSPQATRRRSLISPTVA